MLIIGLVKDLKMKDVFFYIDEYQRQIGPVDKRIFQALGLSPNTFVWMEGMAQWEPACNVSEFRTFFEDNKRCIESSSKIREENKGIWVLSCVILSMALPLFIQNPINVWFRDTFNPSGWIVLLPHLRVKSTLLCFWIVEVLGSFLLYIGNSRWYLYLVHPFCSFCWCVFWAIIISP